MQDLTLVGVHDDGEHLVLTSPDGQRYRVPIDEAVRAAVRRDRARLGQLQLAMDGRLSPKEIQSRIRAGEAAEAIAAASGLPVEQVRRFEGPVLGERRHIADQARRVVLRRSAPAAVSPPTLDDLVSQRLEEREVDPATVAWDAWKLEEGRWAVTVTFVATDRERRALWTYSPQLRSLTPTDDESRWLVDAEPDDAAARRLTAVRGPVYDVGAGGVLRAAPVDSDPDVPEAGAEAGPEPVSATVDLLQTLRERRGRRMRPAAPDEEDDAPDAVQEALETLRAQERAAENEDDAEDEEPPAPRPVTPRAPAAGSPGRQGPRPSGRGGRRPVPDPIRGTHPAGRRMAPERIGAPAEGAERDRIVVLPDTDEAAGRPAPRREPSPARQARPAPPAPVAPTVAPARDVVPPEPEPPRKGRRNVPSWDDIVFGARRE